MTKTNINSAGAVSLRDSVHYKAGKDARRVSDMDSWTAGQIQDMFIKYWQELGRPMDESVELAEFRQGFWADKHSADVGGIVKQIQGELGL